MVDGLDYMQDKPAVLLITVPFSESYISNPAYPYIIVFCDPFMLSTSNIALPLGTHSATGGQLVHYMQMIWSGRL